MKLNFRFRSVPDTKANRQHIEKDLAPLDGPLYITAAHAVVEQPYEGSPEIRAAIHLEVPGPDIVASATDYTFAAAWRKVMKNVANQVKERVRRREPRNLKQLRRPVMQTARA